jgi:DNA-binding PadR family transcriptional regulator
MWSDLWPEVLAAVSLLNDDAEWVTVDDLAEELPHRTIPSLGASLGHLSRWGLVESREGWPGAITRTRYALTEAGLNELDTWVAEEEPADG